MLSLPLNWQEENVYRDCNSMMNNKSTNGENWITTENVKHPLKRQRNETKIIQKCSYNISEKDGNWMLMTKIPYQMDPCLSTQGNITIEFATFPSIFIHKVKATNKQFNQNESKKSRRKEDKTFCSYLSGSNRHIFLSTETVWFQDYFINDKIMYTSIYA